MSTPNDNSPVDVVFTWVDGADAAFQERKLKAMGKVAGADADDIGGDTRYSNLGELSWSIASINRFMPWVRKIFIITDRQDPSAQLELTRRNFPNPIPVEVVDHRTVFKGMEDVLPVFNCNSIESVMWRIPGLSDKYIYFNDDEFVLAPMQREEWFNGDTLICHGKHFPVWAASLGELFRWEKGHRALGFKTPMIASAKTAGTPYFIYFYHTPLAQDRKILESFFRKNPHLLRLNVLPKFRERQQFNPQVLCNILAEQQGRLRLEKSNTNLFLKPVASRPDYLTKRLARADQDKSLRLGCISSLDRASDAQRAEFEQWICNRLQVK